MGKMRVVRDNDGRTVRRPDIPYGTLFQGELLGPGGGLLLVDGPFCCLRVTGGVVVLPDTLFTTVIAVAEYVELDGTLYVNPSQTSVPKEETE